MGSGRHLKNLSASWVGYLANFIILMYLSRLVVRSLGEELFGVWSLIVSVTGYMGLADVGIRNGLGRFINFYQGKGETDKVNEIISTAMMFFILLAVPVFIASWFIGQNFCWLFPKIPPALAEGSLYAMLFTGLNLWLGFLVSSYSLVITSQERFDLFNLTNLVVLGIRAGGTVLVMKTDGGIVQLASVQVFSNAIAFGAFYIISSRVYPELKIRPLTASLMRFRELFGFSFWAFLSAVATKLLYFTDLIVIGAVLGPKMVTLYSIPLTLIDYSRNFVGQVTEILTPRTIKMSSQNDYASLQLMLKWGSKFTMFFAIPFFTGLMFFGPKFMALFWGEEFWDSKWTLRLLVIPQYTAMAVMIGGSIISGLGHIKIAASITLLQALLNFILSVIFILPPCNLGIEGVALGTLIPMVIFNTYVVFLLHRWVHGSVRKFFASNVSRWILSLSGMLIFGYAAKFWAIDSASFFGAFWDGWMRFGFGVLFYAIGSMVISWFLGFHKHERIIMISEISEMLPWNRKRSAK